MTGMLLVAVGVPPSLEEELHVLLRILHCLLIENVAIDALGEGGLLVAAPPASLATIDTFAGLSVSDDFHRDASWR